MYKQKSILWYQLFPQHKQKKQKQPFSMPTLFAELISILVDASMYFNYDFDFIFFTLVHKTIMNLWSETLGRLDEHKKLQLELCTEDEK